MDGWEAFSGDMQQFYGLDLDCLRDDYFREQVRTHKQELPCTRLFGQTCALRCDPRPCHAEMTACSAHPDGCSSGSRARRLESSLSLICECGQSDYYTATAAWSDVHPSQLAGPGACFKEYDLLTVTLDELKAPLQARRSLLSSPVGAARPSCPSPTSSKWQRSCTCVVDRHTSTSC